MRRKLWVGPRLVKRETRATTALIGLFWIGSGLFGIGAMNACGGAPPKAPEDDPYGTAVAQCVDAPRGVSDAATDHMIAVRPGLAVLGSTPAERARAQRDYGRGGDRMFHDEEPQRRVKLHAFRIDRSPVTAAAYAEIVPACGVIPPDAESITAEVWSKLSRRFGLRADYARVTHFIWDGDQPPDARGNHPMVLVTQQQAGFYCAWRGGRLPTAAEWERAARGLNGSVYPWGPQFDASRVNIGIESHGTGDSLEVASRPNGNTPEGFTDMGGLVLEWTHTKAARGKLVVKGNGWLDGRPGYGRGAAKRVLPSDMQDITLGFRCAD